MQNLQSNTQNSLNFFKHLNEGNIPQWFTTMAENVQTFEPVGTPPNIGYAGLQKWLESFFQPIESMQMIIGKHYAAGNEVAICWSGVAKLKNGKDLNFEGVDVHIYNEDGLIEMVKGYFDPTELMNAITQ